MSFTAPTENIAQNYQRSTSFSFAPEGFPTQGLLDLNLDLEKQQQHHLRQFLYFQGLALQRSAEEQQRSLSASEGFDGLNHILHESRPSPDTLSSGSVEDHLHDFITIESLSDTSVSAPSTPDLLGTNIPSLPSRSFASSDLDLSPSSVVQTPAHSMTGAASPLQNASAIAAGCIPHDVQSQAKVNSLQSFDQFGTYAHALPSSAQFPLYYQQAVEMPHLIQHTTSNVTTGTTPSLLATPTRQRSFSVAGTLPNSYSQSAMFPYYVSGHPASYHQLYLAGYIPGQPGISETAMVGVEANHHQRTFSLPVGNLPMHFNPSISLPPNERALAFDGTLESDSIAFDSRRSSLVALSAPFRRKAQEQRSKPYDRAGQTSSRSPTFVSELSGASKSRKPSLNAESSAQESSSGSSIPASIIPESLKDLPASMIRNPHGGGRGYVPGETQEDPKKRHKCGICGRGFARLYNLKSHASTHDPARPKPHECPHAKCSRSFSRLHDLERHRQGIHRDGPLMEAKEQGIAPAVARANTRIAKRAADSDTL